MNEEARWQYAAQKKVFTLLDRCPAGTAKVAEALAKAVPNMEVLVRNRSSHFAKKGPDGKPLKDYADLAQCHKAAAKALSDQGLVVVQTLTNNTEGEIVLCTQLLHSSGEYIESNLPIKAAATDPQKMAAAITYARRTAYCAMLGLAADDDDDGTTADEAAKDELVAGEKRIIDLALKAINEAKTEERRLEIVERLKPHVKAGTVRPSAYEEIADIVVSANKAAKARKQKEEAAAS